MLIQQVPWTRQPQVPVDVARNRTWFRGLEEVFVPTGGITPARFYNSNGARNAITASGTIGSVGGAGKAVEFDGTTDILTFGGSGVSLDPNTMMLAGGTVLIFYNKTDLTNRASSLFGIASGAGASLNIHGPFSDGTTYWDFGGTSGVNRISVAGLSYAKPTCLVFAAGAGGSRIVQDGVVRTSQATSISRTAGGGSTALNSGSAAAGDLIKTYLVAWWSRELLTAECVALSANPWALFAPLPRYLFAPAAAGATAALTGTVTTATEADIVAGGKTIILTLTGDTWVTAGATFDAQRQNIINGLVSAQSEALGWNNVVQFLQGVAGVVRTSATVVTITLDAQATYSITANETITATIPSTAVTLGAAIVAAPTFTITEGAGATFRPYYINQGVRLVGAGVY